MEEDTWNKITDIRVNGSLSHFLSYFSVMEPSSPFLYKSIKIDIMNVIKTDIEGVLIIEPRLYRDTRGYFFESFSEREFKEKVEQNAISEPIGHIMKLVELMKQEDEIFLNRYLHKK